MTKNQLKAILRDYWYDKQYLNEKTKECELISKHANIEINKNLQYSFSIDNYKKQDELRIKQLLIKNKKIEDAIQSLPQPSRSVINFKYIFSMSNEEIAKKMNFSIQRIYQLHNEGLMKLLEKINKNDSNFLAIWKCLMKIKQK